MVTVIKWTYRRPLCWERPSACRCIELSRFFFASSHAPGIPLFFISELRLEHWEKTKTSGLLNVFFLSFIHFSSFPSMSVVIRGHSLHCMFNFKCFSVEYSSMASEMSTRLKLISYHLGQPKCRLWNLITFVWKHNCSLGYKFISLLGQRLFWEFCLKQK